jgi:membrane associated rhomboid family serine protease
VIPLRDINPTHRAPFVTYVLIAINVAVYVYQYLLLPQTETLEFVQRFAVVPVHLFSGYGPSLSTPFTSMFMHGGFAHLLSNLWFLHVFGDNVEDALGHLRYTVFYLFTGVAAVLAHSLIDPASSVPMLGASGAISGVLGAYVLLYPRARVVTFIPIFFLFELPAAFFILVWFGGQLLSGFISLGQASGPGIAFFAHIGGFVAGLVFLFVAGKPKTRPVTYLGPRVSTRRRF